MEKLNSLIKGISNLKQVMSIGISGNLKPFPKPGEGDIDVFIYCDEIPEEEARKKQLTLYSVENVKTNFGNGPIWGLMDYCKVEQVDTFIMYFKIADVLANTRDVIKGKFLWKVNNDYFPIGRLAMFSSINILYDKNNFLNDTKKSLKVYPKELKEKMITYHVGRMHDSENFARVTSRKDVFFYHCILDTAIEHFLMALFALNESYFPSRKRTKQYIDSFSIKPEECINRLAYIIKKGADPENIKASHKAFKELCKDLKDLT